MSLSEPGYYQDGEFGIRLEDVALVVEAKTKVKCHGPDRYGQLVSGSDGEEWE